jgi:ubiquinone/menaquinone biosynthesis C-methylase UbiE
MKHDPGPLFREGSKYAGLHDIDFNIKEGDKVLDVGGGNKPFPASTHVVDFVGEKQQRHFQALKLGDRELIEGDVTVVLKDFPDNYFDFTYSGHCWEHIKDLSKALDEISRTCKRGFSAFPASDLEFITAKNHFGHVNLLRLIGDVLHIAVRPQKTICDDVAYLWEQLWKHSKFNRIFEGHGCKGLRHVWEARMYWEDNVNYVMHEDPCEIYPQLKFF